MGHDDDRSSQYRTLVSARKACRRCEGLANASVICNGRFDSDEIGPWTRWLGDLHARIVIVGQDWGSQTNFEKQRGCDVPTGFVNMRIQELLSSIGVQVPGVRVTSEPYGVYLTNGVLCFKSGNDQSPVRRSWFKACGELFLRPQIDLIRPKVVVCLGKEAYAAVLREYGLPPSPDLRAAVEEPRGVPLPTGPVAFAVYHPAQRNENAGRRSRHEQLEDWKRVGRALNDAGFTATTPGALCQCGCGESAQGGVFRMGHDQKLRIALEDRVGGILALREVVDAAETYASGQLDLEELGRVVRSAYWKRRSAAE